MPTLDNVSTSVLVFLASTALILLAGRSLVNNADVLERETGLTRLWIGSIILGAAASLPELVTSLSAGYLELADLAVGNLLGSNVFNLAVLALLDPLEGKGSLLRRAAVGHILPAAVGVIMSAVVGFALLARLPYSLFGVGADTLLIAAIYAFSVWLIGRYEGRPAHEHEVHLTLSAEELPGPRQHQVSRPEAAAAQGNQRRQKSVQRAWLGLAGAALTILVGGTLLTVSAEATARLTGISTLFVGTVLVAAVTSLPEVVTSASAIGSGAIDLAIGTVLGSNIFNLLLLLFADIVYRPGPLLLAAGPNHALTALASLLLTGITLVGLIYRSRRDLAGFGPDTLFILGAYLVITYFLFIMD